MSRLSTPSAHMNGMTETQTSTSAVRPALERLASKWSFKLSAASKNQHLFFGEQLTTLLNDTADSDLPTAAEALADNWGNAGTGVPESHAIVRGYFAWDLKQAVKTAAGELEHP